MPELGRPAIVEVERERLILLDAIRRKTQAYLMSTDEQHRRLGIELEELLAEHYARFERDHQSRWRGRA